MHRDFKRLTPGHPISARSMNSALGAVEEMDRAFAAGPLGLRQDGAGLQIAWQDPTPRLVIEITGQATDANGGPLNRYSFQQVVYESGVGWVAGGSWSGDGTTIWAAEVNGSLGVPVNFVALDARVSDDGASVEFSAGPAASVPPGAVITYTTDTLKLTNSSTLTLDSTSSLTSTGPTGTLTVQQGGLSLPAPASNFTPFSIAPGAAPLGSALKSGGLWPVSGGGWQTYLGGAVQQLPMYAIAGGTPAAGALLIADGAGNWTPATLTQGSGVTITDAAGSITISTTGGGTVTHTAGALAAGQLVVGNGAADVKVGDLTGDVTTSGSTATTLKNTGTAGTYTKVTFDAQGRETSGTTLGVGDLPAAVPVWTKFTNTFTDFATAATSNTINIGTIPAGSVVLAVKVKHSVQFSGGAISVYNLTGVGVSGGSNSHYFSSGGPLNMDTAPTATNGLVASCLSTTGQAIDSHTGATTVTATVGSVGANLNAATQGSLDIWLLVGTAT